MLQCPPRIVSIVVLALHLGACGTEDPPEGFCPNDAVDVERPVNWGVDSHCSGVAAGYEELFDASVLRRFDITVAADDYATMNQFIVDNYQNATGDLDALPTPPWVSATVSYEGRIWTHVGLRHKGHASLKGAYLKGIRKLSLKLRFDELEDTYPEIADQRFFGFKTINLANGYNDPSLLRDKIGAEIYRDAGVPAARSSFVRVYLDAGEENDPRYMGVYTLIEDPGNRMLEDQLGDGSGNLYKPWSDPGRWLDPDEIGETAIETYFEKHTNEIDRDWSDVVSTLEVLHADRTDAAAWRSNLEQHLDVTAFLRALAVSQVILNWDSYGCKPHNYYVYANPANGGSMTWIPWDLNEVMLDTESATCRPPSSVLLNEITHPSTDSTIDTNWPLISLLLTDERYRASYLALVREVLDEAFTEASLVERIQADHDLIAPYVLTDELGGQYKTATSDAFAESADVLIERVRLRREEVSAALANQ